MCHIWETRDDMQQESTMEQKKEFVKSLRGLVEPGFEFHLSGGEPLLTEGVMDLVDFIAGQGYKTNIVTNGFLIDEPMARRIAHSQLGTLTLSLDGITAETHDFLRGMKGSHARIMQAVEHLDRFRPRAGSGPKISILTVIMGRNLEEIPGLVEWVQQDARLEMVSFQAITQPFGEAMDNAWFSKEQNQFLWPQDKKKVSRTMEKLSDLRRRGYKIGNHPNHFLHFREYFKDPHTFLKKIKCNLGDYEFHVDPYGKTFFCCLTEPIGNIKTERLPDIWGSDRTQHIRQSVYGCKKNCHIMINCFYEDESLLA
jgi:MoaA/NifB/PqqE/SkfB family radical SAM enzyme